MFIGKSIFKTEKSFKSQSKAILLRFSTVLKGLDEFWFE
jgi:hypothetical protein